MSNIVEQIKHLNNCIDNIGNYLFENRKIKLNKKDKNEISSYVADAVIGIRNLEDKHQAILNEGHDRREEVKKCLGV